MTQRFKVPLGVGSVATMFALGVAHAEPESTQRPNMPSASTASTTSGAASHTPASANETEKRGNMPASASSTTKSGSKNATATPSHDVTPPRASDPADPEGTAPDAAVVDLDQIAPVEIIDLQHRLKVRGLYQGDLDGIAGPQTRAALNRYFAKQAALALEGRLDTASVSFCGPMPARL